MPKTTKFSLKGKKKQVVTAVVVILLLALAAGAGVLVQWLQHKGSSDTNGTKDTGGLTLDENGKPIDSLPSSVQEAQNAAAKGDFDQSNKAIATSLATTDNKDEKFDLYFQQGINNENQQKWDDALNSYKQAEAIKKTWQLYSAMGRVAEAKGDKAAALGYYKAALPLIPTDIPLHDFNVNQLQAKITELGG